MVSGPDDVRVSYPGYIGDFPAAPGNPDFRGSPNLVDFAVRQGRLEATAAGHGRLLAHVRRAGAPRGAHDLIVAAHAVEDSRTVLSMDAQARFGDLPGVLALAP